MKIKTKIRKLSTPSVVGEWIHTTIGEQVTLQRGIDTTKAEQRVGTVPVISSSGISSYHDTPAAAGPGVVLGRKGVVGSVYFISSGYWPHDTTLWVKDFHGNDPRFVYYFFRWMAPRLATMDVGSANPTLNRNHIHPISIHWPSLLEQRAIAYILGTLDNKIELNQQMNKIIEAISKSIFKHWFVDFEFPNNEGKSYKSSGGEMIYSDELEKEVPKGWEVKPFSEVIAVNPKRELECGHVAKKVGMADLNPWQAHIENWTCEEYKSGPKFENGDTLFARITPSLEHGKIAFVSILANNEVGFGSTEFIVFGKKVISSELYIFHLSRSNEIRNIAISAMTGTSGRQRVPDDLFNSLPIVVPPFALLDRFETVVSSQFSRIACNANDTKILSQIRNSLLPKLMSGKIRVPIEVK